jgi:hypothetical protein
MTRSSQSRAQRRFAEKLQAKRDARNGVKGKKWGVDHSTNPHLSLHRPPDSLVALRTELLNHPDISAYAQEGANFEDCIGRIAVKLDIVLDGDYDGDTLCTMLAEALRNRGSNSMTPHLRASGLVNAEIVETEKGISLEQVQTEVGVIAALEKKDPDPVDSDLAVTDLQNPEVADLPSSTEVAGSVGPSVDGKID